MEKSGFKKTWRQVLIDQRLRLDPCHHDRLQTTLNAWLEHQPDIFIGAYWPIQGEFNPLPALTQKTQCQIGLPVIDKTSSILRFFAWTPETVMEKGDYGIPITRSKTEIFPTLLLIPCLGYAQGGYRLGYGGGFYDRTLQKGQFKTVGLCFSMGFLPSFQADPHDIPLMVILTEKGVTCFSDPNVQNDQP